MSTLLEILRPGFLLRDALLGSVLVGAVCPLVGAYFVLRRMIFLGVALPQLSAAGIAFTFVVYRLTVGAHEHGNVSERSLAMVGSFAFTLTRSEEHRSELQSPDHLVCRLLLEK